jgi:ribonucleoside-diphosphate reductase alpha chain
MKEQIIVHEGQISKIESIPKDIRDLYKTSWEIKQKTVIDMAVDRAAFVRQSQSMNLFMDTPDTHKLTSMHFYAWEKGLKTGMYYLRTKPRASTQQFTIDPSKSKSNIQSTVRSDEPEECMICSA